MGWKKCLKSPKAQNTLNLHKAKKDISQDTSGPKNVSNNLFVGSTAELQRFLKKGKDINENEKEK